MVAGHQKAKEHLEMYDGDPQRGGIKAALLKMPKKGGKLLGAKFGPGFVALFDRPRKKLVEALSNRDLVGG